MNIPQPPSSEPLGESSSSATPAGRLLVQFFLIPAFVVGVAVFVFWLFGTIAVASSAPPPATPFPFALSNAVLSTPFWKVNCPFSVGWV